MELVLHLFSDVRASPHYWLMRESEDGETDIYTKAAERAPLLDNTAPTVEFSKLKSGSQTVRLPRCLYINVSTYSLNCN